MESGMDGELLDAARCGSFLSALRSLKKGADANAKDAQGVPALALAAHAQGDADILRALLFYGADACAADAMGETGLMKAARRGDPQALGVLLPASDISAKNKKGRTALHFVLESGNVEAAGLLLEAAGPEAWAQPAELLSLCKSARLRMMACVEMEKKLIGACAEKSEPAPARRSI